MILKTFFLKKDYLTTLIQGMEDYLETSCKLLWVPWRKSTIWLMCYSLSSYLNHTSTCGAFSIRTLKEQALDTDCSLLQDVLAPQWFLYLSPSLSPRTSSRVWLSCLLIWSRSPKVSCFILPVPHIEKLSRDSGIAGEISHFLVGWSAIGSRAVIFTRYTFSKQLTATCMCPQIVNPTRGISGWSTPPPMSYGMASTDSKRYLGAVHN